MAVGVPLVVAFITSTDFRQDPRAIKMAAALTSHGCSVHVLAWDRFNGASVEAGTGTGSVVRRFGPRSRPGTGLWQLPGMLAFWVQAWIALARLRPAVVHCNRLDTLLPMAPLARLLGAALVHDQHMDLVERLSVHDRQPGMSTLRKALTRVERFLLARWVTLAIGDSAPATERLMARGAKRAVTVENSPPLAFAEAVQAVPRSDEEDPGPVTVGRIGAFSAQLGQGAEDLLAVAADCPPDLDLRVLMVGNFVPESYRSEVEERSAGLPCPVEVHDYVSYDSVAEQYHRLDIMVIRYEVAGRAAYSRYSSAQKLFEAMACGIPIVISASDFLEALVMRHQCGVVSRSPSPSEVAEAVYDLARAPELRHRLGAQGREAFRTQHAWETQVSRLLEVYPSAVQRSTSRGVA